MFVEVDFHVSIRDKKLVDETERTRLTIRPMG